MDKAILKKICSYCTYQERTHFEVRGKLIEWQVYGDENEEIIAWLIIENFLNEERFAKIYAGSKFRVKKWGRNKIVYALKGKKISDYCIKSGLAEIDEDDYTQVIIQLIFTKNKEYSKEKNILLRNQKTARFLISKGFEAELVWGLLKDE